jgi:magnesium transporter
MPMKQERVSRTGKRRNNLLYENLVYNGSYTNPTEVTLVVFDTDHIKSTALKRTDPFNLAKDKVNWLHVSGLSDVEWIRKLCETVGLHLTVMQDILNARHIAKMEEIDLIQPPVGVQAATDRGLFTVLDAYSYTENFQLVVDHQCFVLGSNWILSFEEGSSLRYRQVRQVLESNSDSLRKQQADYLYNLLISMVVDTYFDVIEQQQDHLMELEDQLMDFKSVLKDTGAHIQTFRKDYIRLKKSILPFRESFGSLLMLATNRLTENSRRYYHDTYDHIQQVLLMLDANREILASLVDMYLANNDLRMNHIMKQLTVIATIFIPLTFLAGIWGMNFKHMPELEWVYGYPAAWILMLLIGVGLYIHFKRHNLF